MRIEQSATPEDELRKLIEYSIDNHNGGSFNEVQEAIYLLHGNPSHQPEDRGQANVFPISGVTRPKAFRQ
jgi:hypothetical protein